MLWVDKHRPKSLDELELHPDTTSVLSHLAEAGDMPHLLFYGPSGAGKKTRVMSLLQRLYGPTVYNIKLDHKVMQVTDSKSINFTSLSSPHHIDINPSDAGNYDRVVVMQLIREIAATAPMLTASHPASAKKGATTTAASSAPAPTFKVIVLNEVDRMTRGAQQALRRTMEKYMATCRLILICSSTSRLIPPLRSRCLGVRVPSHSLESMTTAVQTVCRNENITTMPSRSFLATLHHRSEGNLRRALLMLEASVMNKVDLGGAGADIPQPDWKLYLEEIVRDMLEEQTPKRLHDIRLKYYELLGQCIPAEVILRELVGLLFAAVDPSLRRDIVAAAAQFDHNLKLGTKGIVHLEAFTAAVMKSMKRV